MLEAFWIGEKQKPLKHSAAANVLNVLVVAALVAGGRGGEQLTAPRPQK